MKFTGVLFIIGKPSVLCPEGSRGHKILIAPEAIQDMLENFPGKPLWACRKAENWTHNRQEIAGVIDKAQVIGDMFVIFGTLVDVYETLDIAATVDTLGLSYDISGAYVGNTYEFSVWNINKISQVLGAHIIPQYNAAHKEDCLFWIES